jgi:hypothetical protein
VISTSRQARIVLRPPFVHEESVGALHGNGGEDRDPECTRRFDSEIPEREQALGELKRTATEAREIEREAQTTLTEAVSAEATARAARDGHEQAVAAAAALLADDETLDDASVSASLRSAREADAALAAAEEERLRCVRTPDAEITRTRPGPPSVTLVASRRQRSAAPRRPRPIGGAGLRREW